MKKTQKNLEMKFASSSERGFSLIEIMISVAVMAVVIGAIATFVTNSGKQAASVTMKSEFNSMVNEFQGILNNSETCKNALKTIVVNVADLTKTPKPTPQPISMTIGSATYANGAKYGPTLTVNRLEFVGATQSTTNTSQFVIPLELEVRRKVGNDNTLGGEILKPHVFNLIVSLDADKKINFCAGQVAQFWVKADNTAADAVSDVNINYPGGKVGVNNPNPTTPLDVIGVAQADTFLYRSDARLKENVRDIPNALERVTKLHGVIFDWRNRSQENSRDQLGFLAQDVEKVFPEAVTTGSGSGMKAVGYANLIAPLVEALKEQQEIIRKQQREIEEIRKELKKR